MSDGKTDEQPKTIGKFAGNFDGATNVSIHHGLGTLDVVVSLWSWQDGLLRVLKPSNVTVVDKDQVHVSGVHDVEFRAVVIG